MRRVAFLVVVVALMTLGLAGTALAADPTCVEFFDTEFGDDIANHGQHVVGDYVTGIGHNDIVWPPAGEGGGGAAFLPGGPGAGGHLPGTQPGASFCVPQAESTDSPPGLP